jgi:hypothetical protein
MITTERIMSDLFSPSPFASATSDPTTAFAHLQNLAPNRRGLLLAPLLAALPAGLLAGSAAALDPNQTQVTEPGAFTWKGGWGKGPPHSIEMASVFGSTDQLGQYVVLVRWYPGFMSAPHDYATDRLCFVLSGTWWVNSGADFAPQETVPVRAGGFVRRVARTPHYDGVKKGEKEPAVIGIFGQGPVDVRFMDPSKPPVREV